MTQSEKIQTRYVLLFAPLLGLLLALDSEFIAARFMDGQICANIVLPIWVAGLFYHADAGLRRVILVMLPLSYLGELISSPGLELYFYRGNRIPFYIPFGHAAVFASCTMLAQLPFITKRRQTIVHVLAPTLIVGILAVGLLLNDHLSLFFGLLLIIVLQLKGWTHFYLLMALIVFGIEIVGTTFGCWTWQPESPYLFRTINPPIGAVYIYIVGDVVVQWAAALFPRQKRPTTDANLQLQHERKS